MGPSSQASAQPRPMFKPAAPPAAFIRNNYVGGQQDLASKKPKKDSKTDRKILRSVMKMSDK